MIFGEKKTLNDTPFEAVRIGVVSSINRKKGTARVYFEDREDAVSPELKVISKQTMKTKYYWMPDVNETVICLFLGNGQETGYIIGSPYSDVDQTPDEITNQDRDGIWFEDGTVIKYELDTKTVVIDCVGEITIKANNPINIMAASDVFLEGTLHVTNDVVAGGVSLIHHVHTWPEGTTSEPLKG